MIWAIHIRRTHGYGGGVFGQMCTICRQGGGFPNCVRTQFSRRLLPKLLHIIKKCANIWGQSKLNVFFKGVVKSVRF